jgi:aspartyl-tRNA(Asn)/glutamyl-tRNA(Gln) amidotransferase subunit C
MMLSMKRADIEHLASLARIKLTDQEITGLETDLSKIIDYVSVVSEIAGDDVDLEPQVGARYNVLREDKITNEPGSFTKDILGEMPDTQDGFLKVKKILQTDD